MTVLPLSRAGRMTCETICAREARKRRSSARTSMPLVLSDMRSVRICSPSPVPPGSWVYTKFGYSFLRRSTNVDLPEPSPPSKTINFPRIYYFDSTWVLFLPISLLYFRPKRSIYEYLVGPAITYLCRKPSSALFALTMFSRMTSSQPRSIGCRSVTSSKSPMRKSRFSCRGLSLSTRKKYASRGSAICERPALEEWSNILSRKDSTLLIEEMNSHGFGPSALTLFAERASPPFVFRSVISAIRLSTSTLYVGVDLLPPPFLSFLI